MDTLFAIVAMTWALYLDAAPWLIVGIVAAGLVHAFVPEGTLGRWLGGRGGLREFWAVVKAAVLGAPLPLCSCGVLPAAVGLRREGASKSATVSFLIATPETGPDSIAVSYALLGPMMAVVRPIAAVLSAIVAGLLTLLVTQNEVDMSPAEGSAPTCASNTCCSSGCATAKPAPEGLIARLVGGLRYAFGDILDDIAPWLLVGIVLAGAVGALVPPQGLGAYGSGPGAMVVMLAVGVPLYVCATASTPIAAGLMMAGVSPGAALVFLLAGPATNIATLGVVGKDLGGRALAAYLGGIVISALGAGWLLDQMLVAWNLDVQLQMQAAGETVPEALKLGSGLLLAPFVGLSVYKEARKRLGA